jgi:hypothetical protein
MVGNVVGVYSSSVIGIITLKILVVWKLEGRRGRERISMFSTAKDRGAYSKEAFRRMQNRLN